MRVVGVDLSLTSTGLADTAGNTDRFRTKPTKGDEVTDGLNRMAAIAEAVTLFAHRVDQPVAHAVAIEGPSLGHSRQRGEHMRAGLWWAVVGTLIRVELLRVIVVPPAALKTYATGRGNANKDEVLAAAIKRYPSHDITGNDVADAVVLAALGARLLGHPIDEVPKTHLRALDKLPHQATS